MLDNIKHCAIYIEFFETLLIEICPSNRMCPQPTGISAVSKANIGDKLVRVSEMQSLSLTLCHRIHIGGFSNLCYFLLCSI